MTFIRTIPPEEAEGSLKEIFEADQKSTGYIPNYTHAMSLRPDVITAWRNLAGAIRGHMRLRRYELVTLAAALEMKCRY